jgi:hypothetical protein
MSSVYQDNGYKSRAHYLKSIAEENGWDEETVFMVADMLGPNEDFDGLINTMEDEFGF